MKSFERALRSSYQKTFGSDTHYDKFAAKAGLTKQTPISTKYRNPHKTALRVVAISCAGIVVLFAGVPLTAFVISGIRYDSHFSQSNRFSKVEVEQAKKRAISHLNALNKISYPSTRQSKAIPEDYVSNMDRFSEKIIASNLKEDSFVASTLGLYGNLHLASMSVSDATLAANMDVLLGGTQSSRNQYMKAMFFNNFFQSNRAAVHASQSVFFDQDFPAKPAYLDAITEAGAEAYSCDLASQNAQKAIGEWISNAVGENNFVDTADIFEGDPENYAMLLLSALQFDVKWSYAFKENENTVLPFRYPDGTTQNKTFMTHAFYGKLEDRGTYVTFSDYYCDDYTIQYFVPKNVEDDLADLLPASDYLSYDAKAPKGDDFTFIRLYMPKFDTKSTIDFTPALKENGLGKLYDPTSNVMANAYDVPDLARSYLNATKQVTKIRFQEDGTMARSITFSLGYGATAASPEYHGYTIRLDQRFLYVIRDAHQVPLLIGSYAG